MPTPKHNLLTAPDCAARIGISKKVFYDWIQPAMGAWPPPTVVLNTRMYWREDIVQGILDGEIQQVGGVWVWVNRMEPIPWNREAGPRYGYNPDLSAFQAQVA